MEDKDASRATGSSGKMDPMRISSAEFIGRDRELRDLDAAFAEARAGRATTVLVGAEAGVGKTRLLHEHVDRCREAGAIAVVGGCLELGEGSLPYAPVADALRQLADELGHDRLRALLVGPRRWLARLIPDVVSVPDDGGDVLPAQFFAALHRLFVDLSSEERPVVVVLEDLHWADRSSLDLLRYLARSLGDAHVMIVGTYRSDELHRRHALQPALGELVRLPTTISLGLGPFSPDEVAAQLQAILGHPPAPTLLSDVVGRSGGNAFFVEELAAAPTARSALPTSLRDVLRHRLTQISPTTLTVLRDAAIIGQRFSQALLEAVSAADSDVRASLRDAVDAGALVIDGNTLAFRHALLHEAVAAEVLPGDRTRVHAAVATMLEERPELATGGPRSAPSEIAHHFWMAHDLERAFTASLDAASSARSMSAYAEAHQHGERALELWEQVSPALRPASRARLLLETAQDAKMAGDAPGAIERARAAVEAANDDADVRTVARVEWAGALWMLGRNTEGLEVVLRALDNAGSEPSPALWRAVNYHASMLAHLGRFTEAEAESRKAIELARELADRGLEARALHNWGANAVYADVERAEEAFRKAIAIQLELGDFSNATHTMANLGSNLLVAGRAQEAVEAERRALAIAERRGTVGAHLEYAELMLALGLYRLGGWEEADELIRGAERRPQIPANAILLGAVGGQLALGQGRLDDARRRVDAAEGLVRPDFDPEFRLPLVATRAELQLAGGHPDVALATLEPAVDAPELDEPLLDDRARVVAFAVHVAAELAQQLPGGDGTDQRSQLCKRVAAWVEALERRLEALPPSSATRRAGPFHLARARADLSRVRGASDPIAWQIAIGQAQLLGERPLEAACRYQRAATLIERDAGASPEAEAELRAVLEMAEEIGAEPLRIRAVALAGRVRLRLTDVAAADGTDLTPREREILALVADGWSNPRIAEHLFISPKTVSVHVSNLLRKLGAANRAEAASMAVRLGIVADAGTP